MERSKSLWKTTATASILRTHEDSESSAWRNCSAYCDSAQYDASGIAKNHPHDLSLRRAKRDPHADFVAPLRYGIGEDSVESNCREQQRQGAEASGEDTQHALQLHGIVDQTF